MALRGLPLVDVGVAIDAAVRAGVVFAYVRALAAAAFLAGGNHLARSAGGKELAYDLAVDAVRFENAVGNQVVAAAGVQGHPVRRRDVRQGFGQFAPGGEVGVLDRHAGSPLKVAETALDLAVLDRETEVAALDMALQLLCQFVESVDMPCDRRAIGQHDGIVAPVDVGGTVHVGQSPERGDGFGGRDQVALEFRGQPRDREIEIGAIAPVLYCLQVRQERRVVLRPEHEAENVFRSQIHQIALAAKRIDIAGIAVGQSAHEPVAIKGRYISATGYGYDFRFHGFFIVS
jgi:subtilisin family serine protease